MAAIVGLTYFVVVLFLALALTVTVAFTLLITTPIVTKAKINDPLHPNKNDTRDVPDNPEENPPNPSPPEQQPIQQQPEQPSLLLPPDDNNNNGGNHHHHSSKNKDTTSNDNNIIGLPSIDKFKITENKTGFLVSWSNESYSARAFIHKNSSSFIGMNLVR